MGTNILLYLMTIIIWGTTWFAIRFQIASAVPEIWSVFFRFALAASLFSFICLITRRPMRLTPKGHLFAALLGAFLFSGNFLFIYAASSRIPTGLVAIVFGAVALYNIFFGRIFLKNPVQGRNVVAAFIGIAGMTFCFLPEIRAFSLTDKALQGLLLSLAGAALASLGSTATASKTLKQVPVHAATGFGMIYGALFLGAAGLASGAPFRFDFSTSYVASLVYLALFGSVIAFTAYIALIRRIGLEKAGYVTIVYPVVALAVSTFLEGYLPNGYTAVGIALVLAGNAMMLRKRRA